MGAGDRAIDSNALAIILFHCFAAIIRWWTLEQVNCLKCKHFSEKLYKSLLILSVMKDFFKLLQLFVTCHKSVTASGVTALYKWSRKAAGRNSIVCLTINLQVPRVLQLTRCHLNIFSATLQKFASIRNIGDELEHGVGRVGVVL